jgi:hypothetical protein
MRKAAAATVAAMALSAVFAGAAFADTGSSSTATSTSRDANALAALKQRAATAINVRVSSLQRAIAAVDANSHLTSSDKTTVLNTLNGDITGLQNLAPKIQADATLPPARADYRIIFTGYRVFALALPQTRLAAAVDDITGGVLPRLTDADQKLTGLLAGTDAAKNSPTVQAAMADLSKQISAITSLTSGLPAPVLAITPAQWDANPTILSGYRPKVIATRADVRAARQDIRTVLQALK